MAWLKLSCLFGLLTDLLRMISGKVISSFYSRNYSVLTHSRYLVETPPPPLLLKKKIEIKKMEEASSSFFCLFIIQVWAG